MASNAANLFLKHLVIESSFEFPLSSCFGIVNTVFGRVRVGTVKNTLSDPNDSPEGKREGD
jgi:hypothetical protein